MVSALSRFGTFTGLTTTHSSTSDVYPNTPTFTFTFLPILVSPLPSAPWHFTQLFS